jgi:hypothetical protein
MLPRTGVLTETDDPPGECQCVASQDPIRRNTNLAVEYVKMLSLELFVQRATSQEIERQAENALDQKKPVTDLDLFVLHEQEGLREQAHQAALLRVKVRHQLPEFGNAHNSTTHE